MQYNVALCSDIRLRQVWVHGAHPSQASHIPDLPLLGPKILFRSPEWLSQRSMVHAIFSMEELTCARFSSRLKIWDAMQLDNMSAIRGADEVIRGTGSSYGRGAIHLHVGIGRLPQKQNPTTVTVGTSENFDGICDVTVICHIGDRSFSTELTHPKLVDMYVLPVP